MGRDTERAVGEDKDEDEEQLILLELPNSALLPHVLRHDRGSPAGRGRTRQKRRRHGSEDEQSDSDDDDNRGEKLSPLSVTLLGVEAALLSHSSSCSGCVGMHALESHQRPVMRLGDTERYLQGTPVSALGTDVYLVRGGGGAENGRAYNAAAGATRANARGNGGDEAARAAVVGASMSRVRFRDMHVRRARGSAADCRDDDDGDDDDDGGEREDADGSDALRRDSAAGRKRAATSR